MAGPDPWDYTSLEGAPEDYVGKLDAGVRGLRVRLQSRPRRAARRSGRGHPLVKAAARGSSQLGCTRRGREAGLRRLHGDDPLPSGAATTRATTPGTSSRVPRPAWIPGSVACIEDGMRYSANGLRHDARPQDRLLGQRCARSSRPYDLLLTPTVSVPALPVAARTRALAPARLGLDRLGGLQLSVQLHRAAGRPPSQRASRRAGFPSGSRSWAAASPTSPCYRPRRPSRARAPGH